VNASQIDVEENPYAWRKTHSDSSKTVSAMKRLAFLKTDADFSAWTRSSPVRRRIIMFVSTPITFGGPRSHLDGVFHFLQGFRFAGVREVGDNFVQRGFRERRRRRQQDAVVRNDGLEFLPRLPVVMGANFFRNNDLALA
jgi:hypothetical protein